MKHSIEWFQCDHQTTQERIDFVSKEIGITFPKRFIDLMKECDGGTPEIGSFEYISSYKNSEWGTGIGCFMGFEDISTDDHLLGHHQSEFNYLPEGIIAFAFTGGGDYICFDYRKDKKTIDPEVVYWEHSSPEDNCISFIAQNFDSFMNMLHEDDDEDDD